MLFSLKPSTKYYMLVCGIQFYGNTHQIIIVIYIKKYTAHNDNKRKQRKIQAQNAHRTTQHTYNAYNTWKSAESQSNCFVKIFRNVCESNETIKQIQVERRVVKKYQFVLSAAENVVRKKQNRSHNLH